MQNKLVFTQVTNYLFENPLDDAAGCNDKHMGSAALLPQQLSGESQRGYGEKFKAVGAGGCQQHPAVPRALPTVPVRLNQRCPEASALVLSSALRRAAARPGNTRVTSSSSCCLEMLPTCYCCYEQQFPRAFLLRAWLLGAPGGDAGVQSDPGSTFLCTGLAPSWSGVSSHGFFGPCVPWGWKVSPQDS